jgi:hypothetical protein
VKTEIAVGLKWDHLEIVSMGEDMKVVDSGPGWEDKMRMPYYDAKCTCGGSLRIWECEWKGKRTAKDCGCGISSLDKIKAVKSVNLPLRTIQEVSGFAGKRKPMSFSAALVQLVDLGLEYSKMTE